ncbi:unnamed protein product [Didymodactylos carnosus]|uniref:Uncharacterized protein n=1 Tax=Didymodactylos carnosus TaxID=1234261 RepID=A0A8S2ED99_9BILA|nr:unnamed protein product [Didymodactylos carnosus]CAF3884932.1 unnamed protein product [Didymodactylos carnosus]
MRSRYGDAKNRHAFGGTEQLDISDTNGGANGDRFRKNANTFENSYLLGLKGMSAFDIARLSDEEKFINDSDQLSLTFSNGGRPVDDMGNNFFEDILVNMDLFSPAPSHYISSPKIQNLSFSGTVSIKIPYRAFPSTFTINDALTNVNAAIKLVDPRLKVEFFVPKDNADLNRALTKKRAPFKFTGWQSDYEGTLGSIGGFVTSAGGIIGLADVYKNYLDFNGKTNDFFRKEVIEVAIAAANDFAKTYSINPTEFAKLSGQNQTYRKILSPISSDALVQLIKANVFIGIPPEPTELKN